MNHLPCAGVKTFKYKQSSDWFCRNGKRRFKYSNLPFGILPRADVSFCMLGNRWGHTGLNLSDTRIPSHGDGVRVGLNLKWDEENKNGNIIIRLVYKTIYRYVYVYVCRCT